jgi:hypothetical protein
VTFELELKPWTFHGGQAVPGQNRFEHAPTRPYVFADAVKLNFCPADTGKEQVCASDSVYPGGGDGAQQSNSTPAPAMYGSPRTRPAPACGG